MTWLWHQPHGRIQYTAHHVNIWADMVRRHLTIPHRLSCVTATPEGIDESVEIIKPPGDFQDVILPSWGPTLPQCLRRIAMFRPDASDLFGERFVSMDLDCVVGANIDELFARPEDLVMYSGTSSQRPYNGSMLMMTAGARPHVYTEFTPERATAAGREFIGSDQAWISYILGRGEATWSAKDGIYFWTQRRAIGEPPADIRIMFFPGPMKPWGVLQANRWVERHYRRSARWRVLILGYSPTVWAEAEAALSDGPFDITIASPEAAEHWPGRIDAIAYSDSDAEAEAIRLGAADSVFCGRQTVKSAEAA